MLEIATAVLFLRGEASGDLLTCVQVPAVEQSQASATVLPEIVVVRRRGSTLTPAEIEFAPAEIDGLGADDIGQVLESIARLSGSEGRPLILINGRQLSNPEIYLGFPADALARAEVLPRSASAEYGESDRRRVVNLVLQERFLGHDLTVTSSGPSAGGAKTLVVDLQRSSIRGETASQSGGQVAASGALTASERDLVGIRDPRTTLSPDTSSVSANGMLADLIGGWMANLAVQAQTQTSGFTALIQGDVSDQRRREDSFSAQGGLSGSVQDWAVRVSGTGRMSNSTQSGLAPSSSRNQGVSGTVGASRRLAGVGTGPWSVNLEATGSLNHRDTETPDRSLTAITQFARVRGSVNLPLLWRSTGSGENLPSASGQSDRRSLLTLSVSGASNYAYGAWLGGGSAGLAWTPREKVRLGAAWAISTQAPTEQQRYEPVSVGAPRTFYDFSTGRSVGVLPVVGGDPNLQNARMEDVSASLSVGPFGAWRLLGSTVLRQADTSGAIATLPIATPDLESAFPDRFVRGPDGGLISIDLRPFNLELDWSRTLATNLSLVFPVNYGASGRASNLVRLGLDHRWTLARRTIIKAGLPERDRLAGDDGGWPRHEFTLSADASQGDWTVNASIYWKDAQRLRRDIGANSPGDLLIAPYAATHLRLGFVFPETSAARRAAGVKISFEIDNLFDTRPAARLATGAPAPGYGRDEQDPVGRSFRVAVTRRF